ncbi:MAG TPA: hypothetical protein VGP58_15060, partial [Pyrinomonadaceae bacterium]|nr:hypothetical protein [Pyrinomonadaceae bacterium]
ILENERETSLKTRPDRKRKYVKNDGRKRKVYALQKFLMTLLYLRQNGQSDGQERRKQNCDKNKMLHKVLIRLISK